MSSEYKMRDSFGSAIRFIVQSIKSPALPEPPLFFFTRLLLSKLEYVQKRAVSRHTVCYFVILGELMPQYFDVLQGDQALNF